MRRRILESVGGEAAWFNPYVTDGLVAMWDGEWNAGGGVHDAAATVWKDLIGTRDIQLVGDFLIGDVSVEFLSSAGYGKITSNFDYSTAQIVVRSHVPFGNYTHSLFQFSGYWNRGIRLVATFGLKDGVYWHQKACAYGCQQISVPDSYYNTSDRPVLSISVGESSHLNAVASTDDTDATYVYSSEPYINRSTNTSGAVVNGCKSEYMSMRFYNRALTADEIAANYAVDRERFGIS